MKQRLVFAVALTVVAVVVLAFISFRGGIRTGPVPGSVESEDTTTTLRVEARPERTDDVTTTSVEIPEEWYGKGSSLYSDRRPTGNEENLVERTADDGTAVPDNDETFVPTRRGGT